MKSKLHKSSHSHITSKLGMTNFSIFHKRERDNNSKKPINTTNPPAWWYCPRPRQKLWAGYPYPSRVRFYTTDGGRQSARCVPYGARYAVTSWLTDGRPTRRREKLMKWWQFKYFRLHKSMRKSFFTKKDQKKKIEILKSIKISWRYSIFLDLST